jgi:hypothetical protein
MPQQRISKSTFAPPSWPTFRFQFPAYQISCVYSVNRAGHFKDGYLIQPAGTVNPPEGLIPRRRKRRDQLGHAAGLVLQAQSFSMMATLPAKKPRHENSGG